MGREKISVNKPISYIPTTLKRNPHRKLGSLDKRVIEFAKFAESSYSKGTHQRRKILSKEALTNFSYDTKLSDNDTAVWVNRRNKEVITSYRGTELTNFGDLSADASIIKGDFNLHARYMNAFSKQDSVLKKYKKYRHIVTGHSLGGTIANTLAKSYGTKIAESHSFNPGSGVREIFEQSSDPNHHSHFIKGDVLSYFGTVNRNENTHIYERLVGTDNAHTIKQFQ